MSNVTFPLTRPIRRRKGFSFIEVMVVIMILGLLVGIVGVSLFDSASQATVDATKTQIRGLETALDLYRLHNGRYPQLIKNSVHYLSVQKSVLSQKIGMGLI